MKTGTREWSSSSANCCFGCSNGCLYCYAREQALRFHRIENARDWTTERINQAAVEKGYGKRKGTIMFPTTHDITYANEFECSVVLGKLLAAGNDVLVVSKAPYWLAAWITDRFHEEMDRIELRVTIGMLSESLRQFWEPDAPSIDSRLDALKFSHASGIKTSVSMEPLIEPERALELALAVAPYVTETIWVGACNDLERRTAWVGDSLTMDMERDRLRCWQQREQMQRVYDQLKDNPKIRWKDSYQRALDLDGSGEEIVWTKGEVIKP